MNMPSWKDPTSPMHALYKVLEFLMVNVDDSVIHHLMQLQIDLVLPFVVVRLRLKCVGGSHLFNSIFKSEQAPAVSK
jgi:hypothetical protein